MAWTPPSNASIPRTAEETLVAFESFTYRTPPTPATSSSLCSTPRKVRSASLTGSAGRPLTSAAAEAAIAFCRLWAPRSRSSPAGSSAAPRQRSTPPSTARSEPAGPKLTARAGPGGSTSAGSTAAPSAGWWAKTRNLASR
jgi:hypothetical protein